jgi:mannose-1-phosphate guanylyltransferase
MKAVILCGGAGTRLWPLSTQTNPKQFSKIFDGKSLFQNTITRNLEICDEYIIIVNEQQKQLCKEQVAELNIHHTFTYIIEPCARNTAPAITLAALLYPKDILLVLPSDHNIRNLSNYKNATRQAQEFAKNDFLTTFGLMPDYPETGFGYIEAKGNDVLSFKEKPNLELAKQYLTAGNYFWNSGMFSFKSHVYLNELKQYNQEVFTRTTQCFESHKRIDNELSFSMELMDLIPSISIDFAVMEKSKIVKVVPSELNWSDLGSFDAIYSELDKDPSNNVSNSPTILVDSKNNLIMTQKKLVALSDIEDLILIETSDAILVCKKGHSQKVKDVVEKIKTSDYKNLLK